MKLKGINPFEQHAEKIVVGVMVLIFVAVVAAQFLLHPNRVKVGNNKVAPEAAYQQVEQEARALDAKLKATPREEDLPKAGVVDLAAQFEQALRSPVVPAPSAGAAPRLAGNWPRTEIVVGKVEDLEGARIATPAVPAPTGAVAYAFSNAIDPMEVVAVPALAAFLQSKQQPHDQAAASVEARFDGTSLVKAFEADPDGEAGPLRPMPASWWRGLVEIIGVTLEREELGPTGQWTGLTTVPAPPGRAGPMATLEQDVARTRDMEILVQNAQRDAAQVRRPAYYHAVAGPEWMPPIDAIARDQKGGTRAAIERALKKRAGLEADRQRVASQLGGGGLQPPRPGQGNRGGRNPEPPPRDREQSGAQRRLDRLDEQIAEVTAELASLGHSDDPNARPQAGQSQGPDLPVLQDSAVRVWAHDVTAVPGKTYRYRVRVALNNPVFGRGPALHHEQRTLADARVLLSEPSAWTAPVQAEPTEAYFITSASEGGEGLLGGTQAAAELYKRYYGFWRRGTVSLQPGDRLRAEMKLPKDLFFVDTVQLAAGAEPGATPGVPTPPGPGGGGARPTGPGGAGRPGTGTAPAEATREPWQIPAPGSIQLVLDTVFLDAARVPAGSTEGQAGGVGGARFRAILRDGDGRLVVRSPEDRGSALYARLSESAREGEAQGKPITDPGRPQEGQPEWRPPVPEPERQPSGGGGGGGGGGG